MAATMKGRSHMMYCAPSHYSYTPLMPADAYSPGFETMT